MSASNDFTIGIAVPPTPPIQSLFSTLRWAQQADVDVVSTWDHVVEFGMPGEPGSAAFESQVLLGALARTAGEVRVGVGVTELIRRHPIVVAQTFITLSHVSPRPILGVGAGERMNTRPYGLPFDRPVDRLEEGLAVLRACLDGLRLRFEGEWFRLDAPPLPLRPPLGAEPQVWVGGRGPRMLELVGRFGNGWYPADIVDPETYASGLSSVRASAERSERDPDAIVPAAELVVFAGRSSSEVDRVLASPGAKLHGLLLGADVWASSGREHPLGGGFRGFVDYVAQDVDVSVLDAVPPELVDRHALAGTPEVIAGRVATLREAGLRHVTLSFGALAEPGEQAAAHEVVTAVRKRMAR